MTADEREEDIQPARTLRENPAGNRYQEILTAASRGELSAGAKGV